MTPRVCRMCREGLHPSCTGLRCHCRATLRCARTAKLVEDRIVTEVIGGAIILFLVVLLLIVGRFHEHAGPVEITSTSLAPPSVTTLAVEPTVSAAQVSEPVATSSPPVARAAGSDSLDQIDPRGVWRATAHCESNGRKTPTSPVLWINWDDQRGPYEGGLHFLPETWRLAGGYAYALHAYEATPYEQILVARLWLGVTDVTQWPTCGRIAGLRDSDGLGEA